MGSHLPSSRIAVIDSFPQLVASFFEEEDDVRFAADRRPRQNAGTVQPPFQLRSRKASATFVIDIALPPPYVSVSGPWPVLLITDGNLAFPTAASTAGILPIEPGGPLPVCVVGIGYPLPLRARTPSISSCAAATSRPCGM
jgi:hypothetical protein